MDKTVLARHIITRLAETELRFKSVEQDDYWTYYKTCARIGSNRHIRAAVDAFWEVYTNRPSMKLAAD